MLSNVPGCIPLEIIERTEIEDDEQGDKRDEGDRWGDKETRGRNLGNGTEKEDGPYENESIGSSIKSMEEVQNRVESDRTPDLSDNINFNVRRINHTNIMILSLEDSM